MGKARSPPSRTAGGRWSRPADRRPSPGGGGGSSLVTMVIGVAGCHGPAGARERAPAGQLGRDGPGSAGLDLLPGLDPGREVGALHIGPTVETVRDGGGPVPDLLPVVRFRGVEDGAVVRVLRELARLAVPGRLTEVLGDL